MPRTQYETVLATDPMLALHSTAQWMAIRRVYRLRVVQGPLSVATQLCSFLNIEMGLILPSKTRNIKGRHRLAAPSRSRCRLRH